MPKTLTVSFFVFMLIGASAFGQITIATNNFQPAPGEELNNFFDIAFGESDFNSLAAGSGGPMVWDFSSRTFNPLNAQISVDPMTVPSIDQFPDGNLVLMELVGTDTSWQVNKSIATEFTMLGSVYHGSSGEVVSTYDENTPDVEFPINYNDQWTSYRLSSMTSSNSYTLYFDTTDYIVDAWGTIQYGSNSAPCLRVRSERRHTFKTYDEMDMLLDSNTQYTTLVTFVAGGFDRAIGASKFTFLSSTSYACSATGKFINGTSEVDIIESAPLPDKFHLAQNYPNPFNPATRIDFGLPSRSHVKISIYDILGREISTPVNEELGVGQYSVEWDGRNAIGQPVASGVYFYRLTADDFTRTRKMLLLK